MYKRIIVKVGTKVLTDKHNELDHTVVKSLVEQIVAIRQKGCEVVLVSSGAMGAGRALLKKDAAPETTADKQVFAAVGQVALMNAYNTYLKKHKVELAQVLVTKEDFRDKTHYQNMETCFTNLLQKGVLPIVNENDVVAVKELLFTDNDELTSLIALQLDVDAVYILTSVDGVIAGDIDDPQATVLSKIDADTIGSIEKFITLDRSSMGRGGMLTKFAMARKLMSAGIAVHFLNGKKKKGILAALAGEAIGTKFVASKKVSARKRKLAHGDSLARGEISINARLAEKLRGDKTARSILPIGIISAKGDFEKGDLITIVSHAGTTLGCGITKFDKASVQDLIGKHGGRAIVHYDDLFLLS